MSWPATPKSASLTSPYSDNSMLAANEFQNARLDYNGYQIKMTKEYNRDKKGILLNCMF